MSASQEENPVRRLPSEFTRNGFHYHLNRRNAHACLYFVRREGTEELCGYEVILPNIQEAEKLYGKSYPRRETYPPTASWGQRGRTYPPGDFERAIERYHEVTRKAQEAARVKAGSAKQPKYGSTITSTSENDS